MTLFNNSRRINNKAFHHLSEKKKAASDYHKPTSGGFSCNVCLFCLDTLHYFHLRQYSRCEDCSSAVVSRAERLFLQGIYASHEHRRHSHKSDQTHTNSHWSCSALQPWMACLKVTLCDGTCTKTHSNTGKAGWTCRFYLNILEYYWLGCKGQDFTLGCLTIMNQIHQTSSCHIVWVHQHDVWYDRTRSRRSPQLS